MEDLRTGDLTMEGLDKIQKIVDKLKIEVELVTDCGTGTQYVEPERISIQDNGTVTVTVRAWKDKSYK